MILQIRQAHHDALVLSNPAKIRDQMSILALQRTHFEVDLTVFVLKEARKDIGFSIGVVVCTFGPFAKDMAEAGDNRVHIRKSRARNFGGGVYEIIGEGKVVIGFTLCVTSVYQVRRDVVKADDDARSNILLVVPCETWTWPPV